MGKEAADKEAKKKTKRPTPLKRDAQSARGNQRNRIMKARINTAVRSFEQALQGGDGAQIKSKLNEAYSVLDKAAQKGILKKNTSSRKKARLTARLAK